MHGGVRKGAHNYEVLNSTDTCARSRGLVSGSNCARTSAPAPSRIANLCASSRWVLRAVPRFFPLGLFSAHEGQVFFALLRVLPDAAARHVRESREGGEAEADAEGPRDFEGAGAESAAGAEAAERRRAHVVLAAARRDRELLADREPACPPPTKVCIGILGFFVSNVVSLCLEATECFEKRHSDRDARVLSSLSLSLKITLKSDTTRAPTLYQNSTEIYIFSLLTPRRTRPRCLRKSPRCRKRASYNRLHFRSHTLEHF